MNPIRPKTGPECFIARIDMNAPITERITAQNSTTLKTLIDPDIPANKDNINHAIDATQRIKGGTAYDKLRLGRE
jgi:hypothetical protein